MDDLALKQQRIICLSFQQLPVWYEVSYSLAETETEAVASPQLASSSPSSSAVPRHLIYRGLSHQITFRLPAGLPEHGRKGKRLFLVFFFFFFFFVFPSPFLWEFLIGFAGPALFMVPWLLSVGW